MTTVGLAMRNKRLLRVTYKKFNDIEPYDCILAPHLGYCPNKNLSSRKLKHHLLLKRKLKVDQLVPRRQNHQIT